MPKVTIKVPIEVQTLPLRLQDAMKRAGVNQPELARRSGVAQSAISNLCSAARSAGGSLGHVVLIANALGIRVGWLAVGEEPMRAPGSRAPVIVDADAIAGRKRSPHVSVRTKEHK